MRVPVIIIVGIIYVSLFSCKKEDIILHGDITGFVTDASTNLPIQDAKVKLNPSDDSTSTGDDGYFGFKNLIPGVYEIQALKSSYASGKENIVVSEAETKQIDFSLIGIPLPTPSIDFLDFGLDSTTLRFTLYNGGKGDFAFILTPNLNWITVSPTSGFIRNDSVVFVVTVNKTGLTESIYKENIKVKSFAGQVPLPDIIIPVYLNGVSDHDGNYYKVVTIGTQIWMAENLNVGVPIPTNTAAKDNGIIEKYCYDNSRNNCIEYGGLYQWDEGMLYHNSDDGIIGITQGICPVGWHIPTENEWFILFDYLGGRYFAGGKLKEEGYKHWLRPNMGATNEIGFSALPAGVIDPDLGLSKYIGLQGNWWSSNAFDIYAFDIILDTDYDFVQNPGSSKSSGHSVRCVKNP